MKIYQMLAGLVVAAGLVAQPGPGGFRPGGAPGAGPGQGPTFTELKAYLTLTDAQVTSLQQLRQQEGEAMKTEHEAVRAKQTELRAAVEKGDAAAAGRLLIEVQALQKRIGEVHTRYYANAVAVLNTAQKTKLQALEEAIKLMPTIGQARALNLLAQPDRPAGAGPMGRGHGGMGMGPGGMGMGPGGMGMGMGPGPMGFGGPQAPR